MATTDGSSSRLRVHFCHDRLWPWRFRDDHDTDGDITDHGHSDRRFYGPHGNLQSDSSIDRISIHIVFPRKVGKEEAASGRYLCCSGMRSKPQVECSTGATRAVRSLSSLAISRHPESFLTTRTFPGPLCLSAIDNQISNVY